jgi:hypothetical protein
MRTMATIGREPRAPAGEVDVEVGVIVEDVRVRVVTDTLAKVVVVGVGRVTVEGKEVVGAEVADGVAEVGGGVRPPYVHTPSVPRGI